MLSDKLGRHGNGFREQPQRCQSHQTREPWCDGNKIRRYLEVSEVAYHNCKDARLNLVDVKLHIVIANLPTVIWF
jgi:hypothetical protein